MPSKPRGAVRKRPLSRESEDAVNSARMKRRFVVSSTSSSEGALEEGDLERVPPAASPRQESPAEATPEAAPDKATSPVVAAEPPSTRAENPGTPAAVKPRSAKACLCEVAELLQHADELCDAELNAASSGKGQSPRGAPRRSGGPLPGRGRRHVLPP